MRVTSADILSSRFSRAHQWCYLILIAAALFLIALLDHLTGDLPLQHLYYLPIILAATRFRMRGGLIVAFTSVLLYHVENPRLINLRHNEGDIVQIVLFFTVGVIAAKLNDDANRMRLLAITDDLTGLHNLRSFEAQLTELVTEARLKNTPLSLLVLDVDLLKSLNDSFGHLAGADAVRTVGHLIASHIPSKAVACRFGGDEFVIAVPECTIRQAVDLAELLREAVRQVQPTLASHVFPARTLSISVGATTLERQSLTPGREGEELFRTADRALYRAKQQGRNSVCALRAEQMKKEI